jgi:hypothetical protein
MIRELERRLDAKKLYITILADRYEAFDYVNPYYSMITDGKTNFITEG